MNRKAFRWILLLSFLVILIGLLSVSVFAEDGHSCTGRIKVETMVDGGTLAAQCRRCRQYVFPQQVSVDLADGTVFCKGNCEIQINDTGLNELTTVGYVVLYEGTGDTSYEMTTVAPTDPGTYTVFLTFDYDWEQGAETVRENRTTPVSFTIATHEWTYTADARSLYATCQNCGASAKVTLDDAAVYEAARNADCEQACEALFCEEDWNGQEGILPYSVLYSGTGLDESGRDVVLVNTLQHPQLPGTYTARLVLLTNGLKAAYDVGTEAMPFFVTGIPMVQCEVRDYTEEEIAAFVQPRTEGKTYYVGNASELLWCVYNQTVDMNLVLTNDIIVNPIAITDEETVSCGASVIYKWVGFGTKNNRFAGTVDGNGHTIYGLYMPQANPGDWVSGFICWGKNVWIENLTIESSYFKATNGTGAFFGELLVDGTKNAGLFHCHSLYNVIVSDAEAGGLVGWLNGGRATVMDSFVTIENCSNDSYVNGTVAAGGIVGKTAPSESEMICGGTVNHCHNYGTVVSRDAAGGICGSLTPWNNIGFAITNCLNTGYVKATMVEGGILGEVYTHGQPGDVAPGCINVSDNINIGELDFAAGTIADVIAKTGDIDYYSAGLLKLDNNYYMSEENAYPVSLLNAPDAVSLSRSAVKAGTVCKLLGGHTAAQRYSNVSMATCEQGGAKDLCCSVCGTVMETVEMTPHGHVFLYGVCLYCGQAAAEQSGLNASIFSSGSWVVILVASVGIIGTGVLAVVWKNKKKKAVAPDNKE